MTNLSAIGKDDKADARISSPGQMDCPWCGCGWLFICSRCRKAFTFAEAFVVNEDETAWLEAMSALAANGRHAEIDYRHLSEYLADMAKRDKREVFSRLVALLCHLLKWEDQPERRSGSW